MVSKLCCNSFFIIQPKKIHFWGCDFWSLWQLYSDLSGGDEYAYKVDFSYYEKK